MHGLPRFPSPSPSSFVMASALVNTVALSPPPPPLPAPPEAFPWLSPRISFSHDVAEPPPAALPDSGRPDASPEDFEFRLHDDPVAMLPADELFSEGKLVPLQLAAPRHAAEIEAEAEEEVEPHLAAEAGSPETRRKAEIVGIDPYAFSPRAPRCTARWRELLGLKRAARVAKPGVQAAAGAPAAAAAAAAKSASARSSIRHLLPRHSKAASLDASMNLPLLRDSDHESPTIASRLSHSSSSSSSGPEHEDLARLSVDSDKPTHVPPRVRLARPRPAAAGSSRAGPSPSRRAAEQAPPRAVSVDSPRMSSSGKIVFQGLERSSSSPGSFTGGPRPRARGVERSYSANVRVAPVLNVVPVCSLRGSGKPVSVFGLTHLFSPQQRKDRDAASWNRAETARSGRRQRRQDQERSASPKIN